MVGIRDDEIDVALLTGDWLVRHGVRIASARYDESLDRLIIELTNGSSFAFPPRIAQGLEHASAEALAEVEVLGVGTGLHWESLDVDLSIEGLLNGRLGSQKHMALGRLKQNDDGAPLGEGIGSGGALRRAAS